jgi:hypothetical protein
MSNTDTSQDSYFVAHSMNKAIDEGRYEEVDAFGGFDYDDDGNDMNPFEFYQDSYFVAHSMNTAIDEGRYEEVDAFGGFDYDDDGNDL